MICKNEGSISGRVSVLSDMKIIIMCVFNLSKKQLFDIKIDHGKIIVI